MILHRKIFYIMRHGQTTDNEAGMISGGGRDVSLTNLGREQAVLAAQAFLNLSPKPERIVVSALIRTHETARIVCGHDNHVIDRRMNERYLGELDGTITEEEQKLRINLPGEESVVDQAERVLEALNEHLSGPETVLFVCHGGTVRRVLEATGLKGKAEAHNGIILALSPENEGWTVRAIS